MQSMQWVDLHQDFTSSGVKDFKMITLNYAKHDHAWQCRKNVDDNIPIQKVP
jgi:hypothetical protein